MSVEPTPDSDNSEYEADQERAAMQAQLRKDVDSWNKARSDTSQGHIGEPRVPVKRSVSAQPVAGPKKPAAVPSAAKPSGTPSKPFSMSYGGESTKTYMKYLIARGIR